MGLGEISLGEMGLGEMGLGEMGQNPVKHWPNVIIFGMQHRDET